MGFLIGLLTMVCVFALVCLTAIIYDAGGKVSVRPYFLRMGRSVVDMPRSAAEIGNRRVRDWLIQKYVKEMFYVIPDVENVHARMQPNNPNNMMFLMSDQNVFKRWTQDVAPELQEMAANGVRRTVKVYDEIIKPEASNYFRVDYELKTWYKPNDMTEIPTIEHGTIYLELADDNIEFRGGNIQRWLSSGRDPAAIFRFAVQDVVQ